MDATLTHMAKPFKDMACDGRSITVLMTTRSNRIVELYCEEEQLRLRPFEDDAATKILVQSSGKPRAELHSPSLQKLVKMCDGLPAMLRSVGRSCRKRSAEGVLSLLEKLSKGLDRTRDAR